MSRVLTLQERQMFEALHHKRFSFINNTRLRQILDTSSSETDSLRQERRARAAAEKQRLIDAGILY